MLSIQKGGSSVLEFLSQACTIANHLEAIGEYVLEKDLIHYALSGLDLRFYPFTTSMQLHDHLPTFDVLYGMMLAHEKMLDQQDHLDSKVYQANATHFLRPVSDRGKSNVTDVKLQPWSL